jgi:C-terminal processing protease CtpA/Prc
MKNFRFAVLMTALFLTASPQGTLAGDSTVSSETRSSLRAHAFYAIVIHRIREDFLWPDKIANWPGVDENDLKLDTFADAERAVRKAIAKLPDRYTEYYSAKETTQENIEENLASSQNEEYSDLPAVSRKLLAGNIGYIRIRTFDRYKVTEELQVALLFLDSARGYILDLDGNPGGFTDQGFSAFSLFVDEGKYAIIKGKQDGCPYTDKMSVTQDALLVLHNSGVERESRQPNLAKNKPVVILVDGDTASAAEMFTNAMMENHRACSVGVQTFGKGIGQTVYYDIPGHGSLRVTDMRVFTPSGKCIHGTGIHPDNVVEGNAAQIAVATAMIEQELQTK